MSTLLARVLAALFGVGVLSRAADVRADHEQPPKREGGPREVERLAIALADILDLSETRQRWLVNMHLAQANSESGSRMNNLAANRSDSESKASKRLFFARENDERLGQLLGRDISSDPRWWFPGSGGWFGLFPVNLINLLGGRSSRDGLGPTWVYDPWASTVGYAAYVDGLTSRRNWKDSSQDARAVKIGGAAGSLMDNPEHTRAKKAVSNLMKAVSKQGLPSGFPTQLPGIRQIYAGRDWLEVYREGVRRGL